MKNIIYISVILITVFGFTFWLGRQSQLNIQAGLMPYLRKVRELPPRPLAPMTVVVPCAAEDLLTLPMFLTSLYKQTLMPAETILVMNVPSERLGSVEMLNFNSRNETVDVGDRKYYEPYVNDAEPLDISITKIPEFSIRIRSKSFFAGGNRAFGSHLAGHDLVSFFDCDDYMLPERTEFLYKVSRRRRMRIRSTPSFH